MFFSSFFFFGFSNCSRDGLGNGLVVMRRGEEMVANGFSLCLVEIRVWIECV